MWTAVLVLIGEADDVEQTNSPLTWRKSTRCGTGACVEVAGSGDHSLVRDAKDPAGPVLAFSRPAWRTFLTALRAGEFDQDR